MSQAAFFDPVRERTVHRAIGPDWHVADLVHTVLGFSSGRGHPAAEVIGEGGSSVTLGTDGERAILVWVDSLGQSFRSIGAGSGDTMVFDFFGSWSEAPGDWIVTLADALEALEQYVVNGSPATERVMFEPD
jgi:hypothetical protein